MHEGLVPEASLGTHFFNDLVEANMLYCAVYPGKEGNVIDRDFFERSVNKLASLVPEAKPLSSAVKVIDGLDSRRRRQVCVKSDVMKQRLICYLDEPEPTRK